MNRQVKTSLLCLLVMSLMFGLALAPAVGADMNDPAPEMLIRESTDALIAAIEEAKDYFDADPERFYARIEEILDPVVDFNGFSRSVMAVHYKRASDEQRDRFSNNFRNALVRTYGKALLEFNNEKIEVMLEERQPSKPTRRNVRMEVTSNAGQVYPVIYSMHYSDGQGWRIRNIIVNGINIGLTYRNQFGSAMSNSDLETVINDWAETVANVDPVAGEESESSASGTTAGTGVSSS